jgi:hypothetical protein
MKALFSKVRSYFVADLQRWYKMGTIWLHVVAVALIAFVRENPHGFQNIVAQLPASIQPHVPAIGYVIWAMAVPFVRLLDLGKQAQASASPTP